MIDTKEKTALIPSVGAEEGQSFQTISENIIPTSESEINDQIENSGESFEEMCRRMQRLPLWRWVSIISERCTA